MSEARLRGAVLVALVLMLAGAAQAQDETCPNGAVNTITGNYTGVAATVEALGEAGVSDKCEICLHVRVQTGDFSWEEAGMVCDIWSEAQAHAIMYKIGVCGLIVPSFESVGVYYGTAVPIRVEASRMPPCAGS